MIVYLDTSALVKLYMAEASSSDIRALVLAAEAVGTALNSRAEVGAALAKAMRVGALLPKDAESALLAFRAQWPDFIRLQLTETIMARAEALAWELTLWGFDAMHLAAALVWQETLGEPVTLATFDRQLWEAGRKMGMIVWPEESNPPFA